MPNPFETIAAALGFSEETTGGGCVVLTLYHANGGAIWVTDDGGLQMPCPASPSFLVGIYDVAGLDDMAPRELIDGQGLAAYARALGAALEALEALPVDQPGDDPCPIHRQPISRCPDSCDHGA